MRQTNPSSTPVNRPSGAPQTLTPQRLTTRAPLPGPRESRHPRRQTNPSRHPSDTSAYVGNYSSHESGTLEIGPAGRELTGAIGNVALDFTYLRTDRFKTPPASGRVAPGRFKIDGDTHVSSVRLNLGP